MHNSAGPGHVSAPSWDLYSPVMLRYLPTVAPGIQTEMLFELASDSPSYRERRAVAEIGSDSTIRCRPPGTLLSISIVTEESSIPTLKYSWPFECCQWLKQHVPSPSPLLPGCFYAPPFSISLPRVSRCTFVPISHSEALWCTPRGLCKAVQCGIAHRNCTGAWQPFLFFLETTLLPCGSHITPQLESSIPNGSCRPMPGLPEELDLSFPGAYCEPGAFIHLWASAASSVKWAHEDTHHPL